MSYVCSVRQDRNATLYLFFCYSTNVTLVQMDRQVLPESVINKIKVLRNDHRYHFLMHYTNFKHF